MIRIVRGIFEVLRLALVASLVLAAQRSRAGTPPLRSLYGGALVRFERAIFLKPGEATNETHAVRLAPLIIQEIAATNALSTSTNPASKADNLAFKPSRIFYLPGSVALGDSNHEQMTYWWHYESAAGTNWAGVRLTMSTNGVPMIYEVLESERSIHQVFVSQSIEAAARDEFGPPLPGRRHSTERSLRDAPDVVVPRVIDDSPDVMGPFLYLEAESHFVATLICRCMTAQFRQLAGQGLYELVPGDFSGNLSPATRLDAANPRRLPEDFLNSTNRLSRGLRLPRDF